jgi:signal transduction histidine kinase
MESYDERGSYGLRNLQERAELVNGRTTIHSVPGEGSLITLLVPLSRDAV